jgi:hypothetical protein
MRTAVLVSQFILLISACITCRAAETKTQTLPEWYVGDDIHAPAQMALQVDMLEYAGHPAASTFIVPEADKGPESVLARYIDSSMIKGNVNLEEFSKFFDQAEDHSAIKTMFDAELAKARAHIIKGVTFDYRYDVGDYSFIAGQASLDAAQTDGVADFGGIYILKHTDKGWVMTGQNSITSTVYWLIALDTSNRSDQHRGSLADSYQYNLELSEPVAGINPNPHRCFLRFNARSYDLRLAKDAKPTDQIATFVNHAWLVSKEGALADWAQLFPEEEAKAWKDGAKESPNAQSEYFTVKEPRLICAIDFGPEAAAFLENGDDLQAPLQVMLLWKGKGSDYKLTDGSSSISDGSTETTFAPNLPLMFQSKGFQDGLRRTLKKVEN